MMLFVPLKNTAGIYCSNLVITWGFFPFNCGLLLLLAVFLAASQQCQF